MLGAFVILVNAAENQDLAVKRVGRGCPDLVVMLGLASRDPSKDR